MGVSTGLDYLTNPEFEEHVLHYFAPELSQALPSHPNTELVFRFHHRSGVFGTFGDVREGLRISFLASWLVGSGKISWMQDVSW